MPKVQRTFMPFKSLYGSSWIFALYFDSEGAKNIDVLYALDAAGGSWLGFVILTLMWIGSLVFDTPMIRILALYLDFEGAKNIHIL